MSLLRLPSDYGKRTVKDENRELIETLRAFAADREWACPTQTLRDAAAALEAKDRMIEQLCEALTPFAASADWPLSGIEDDRPVHCRVYPKIRTNDDHWVAGFGYSVGEFIKAKEALSNSKPQPTNLTGNDE
jgi:hypothetical protein